MADRTGLYRRLDRVRVVGHTSRLACGSNAFKATELKPGDGLLRQASNYAFHARLTVQLEKVSGVTLSLAAIVKECVSRSSRMLVLIVFADARSSADYLEL